MNDFRNVGQDVQAEILKTARKGQRAVAGVMRTWAGRARSITPPLKELNLPFAGRLPFASRLPRPEELAENAYEFAQRLLASQRKFAEGMLHAAAPIIYGKASTDNKNGTDKKNGPAGTEPGKPAA
jgi:hypothetical protein